MKETDIQRQIIDYLTLCGHLVCRMPMGGVRHTLNGKTFYKKNPLKGFPDLFFFHADRSGTMICIEVKTEKGRQSAEQKQWQAQLKAYGIECFVARSVDDVRQFLGGSTRELF